MTTRHLLAFPLLLVIACGDDASTTDGGTSGTDAATAADAGSAAGLEIVSLINGYREENGLTPIPASPSLCTVAATHVTDLATNRPNQGSCNLHSWSDQGEWGACCYTPDHAEAQCMWDKPRELTDYPGNGYENAYAGSNSPASAVRAWQNSSGHNAVILNEGIWAGRTWRALGAEIRDGYGVLWFGDQADPASR